jgi:hypothetical protein
MMTQLLPFIGYPRILIAIKVINETAWCPLEQARRQRVASSFEVLRTLTEIHTARGARQDASSVIAL